MTSTIGAVHELLLAAADAAPDHVAITDDTGTWTYRELLRASASVAAWLTAHGARAGDRVVLLTANRREVAAVCFGASLAGCLFVPLNPATRTPILRSILADAEPAVVLASPALASIVDEHPVHDIAEACADSGAPPVSATHEVFALLYTSGSTATPKAVVCPHRAVRFAVDAIGERLGYRADDVIHSALPLSFDYGLYQILLSVRAHGTLVVAPAGVPTRLLADTRANGATVVPVVPSLAQLLITLARRHRGPSTVRLFTSTGDTLTPALAAGLRAACPGARVVPMFGITECKRVSIAEPDADLRDPTAVGTPLPGTTVEILDSAGDPVPAGETGEVVVSGPHVMSGYWRAPELTARIFRADGPDGRIRLHTGDFGYLDEGGQLHFAGRRDGIFKRRGVRMSTTEIEAAALAITGVHAAVALPPRDGHDLVLFAVTELAAEEVLAGVAQRLEPAKVPVRCEIVANIPLNPNGKPARARLAEQAAVR